MTMLSYVPRDTVRCLLTVLVGKYQFVVPGNIVAISATAVELTAPYECAR